MEEVRTFKMSSIKALTVREYGMIYARAYFGKDPQPRTVKRRLSRIAALLVVEFGLKESALKTAINNL